MKSVNVRLNRVSKFKLPSRSTRDNCDQWLEETLDDMAQTRSQRSRHILFFYLQCFV